MDQVYPYDDELSYHLANLALVGEVQPIWEASDPKSPDLDDLFAIPRPQYGGLLLIEPDTADDIYADIHGYVRNYYDLVGAIRIGQAVIPDYDEMEPNAAVEINTLDDMLKAMSSYSHRVSEALSNSVRYGFSKLLMGYALRSKTDGHGIIVTRGTVSTDEWLNNINYRLVPFHPLDAQYGNVHKGFRDVYKGIRGRYRELVEQFDVGTPLYLVGHSLGAAIAQLAALDIAVRSPERASQLQVYGYAPPRVGDATFADVYNRLVGTSYRIVNVCDVVPYLPFDEIGTLLRQKNYPYMDTKGELGFVHQAGNPVANHISSYHLATRLRVPAPIHANVPRRLS